MQAQAVALGDPAIAHGALAQLPRAARARAADLPRPGPASIKIRNRNVSWTGWDMSAVAHSGPKKTLYVTGSRPPAKRSTPERLQDAAKSLWQRALPTVKWVRARARARASQRPPAPMPRGRPAG